jgi:glyoxylase-like metal-dependent hydrolase (beta-lactamase superfamily II)
MQLVAPDVWQIPLAPRNAVNAYLLGDVVVDAGIGPMGKRIAERVRGRNVAAHALTHAHPDHVGGSKALIEALGGIPMWAPAGDAAAVERGSADVPADLPAKGMRSQFAKFPAVRVDRRLSEGDEVAGFQVLEVPGHSPGHIAFWRESDRVLVQGDVFFGMNVVTMQYGLRQPLRLPTVDPELNRQSERRLADLEPDIVCFGHGKPLTGAAPKLREFVAKL